MATSAGIFGTSVAKKFWMALTGLFLILFLLVHLIGNLQLLDLSEEGRIAFNEYTVFMTSFPVVKVVSYVLYLSILFHAIEGLWLAVQNRKARGSSYKNYKPGRKSVWASRQMSLLGTIILAFLIMHMGQFWFSYKFGEIPLDSVGNKDMAQVVVTTFSEGGLALLFVVLYVIAQAAIGFHLWHGFESTFQSLGITSKTHKLLQFVGRSFALVVSLAFAVIPVYIYLNA